MNEVMFAILQGIVGICIILCMRYLLPYLKYKLTSVIDVAVWNEVVSVVKAMEQTIKGSGKGVYKKEQVVLKVTAWLNKHGIDITQEQLSDLIESAVWVMNNEESKK